MASVDVPVALLGYGTVGAAVNRLLTDSADDIERATCHRIPLVKALVRDPEKERDYRIQIQRYLEEHGASLRPMDPALASYISSRVMAALLHGTAQDAPEWLEHPHFADEVTELLVRYLAR